MLAQPDIKDYGEYKFGEVTIRYKKYMTKKLRRILAVSDRKVKSSDDPLDAQDEAVYSALAEICVDAPWTSSSIGSMFSAIRSRRVRICCIDTDTFHVYLNPSILRSFHGELRESDVGYRTEKFRVRAG